MKSSPPELHEYAYVGNNPATYADPSGRFLLNLALGAVGAVASGGTSLVTELVRTDGDFSQIDRTKVMVATGTGFVASALAPVVATSAIGAAALGGTANIVQYAANNYLHGQAGTILGGAVQFGTGAVGGAIGGALARGAGLRFDETSPWIDPTAARGANEALDMAANVTLGNLMRNVFGAAVSGADTGLASDVSLNPVPGDAGLPVRPGKK